MHTDFKTPFVMVLISCLVLAACVANPTPPAAPAARDTLYQVSTLNSLMAGNYDGIETGTQVAQKGDLGIGTFDGLDGEMVMLDGKIYQVKDTGKVEMPASTVKMPFLAVTYFDADIAKELAQVQNFEALKAALDPLIVKKDRFYAIKIEGTFSKIQVRSVPKQQKPYPILSEVTKNQPVFNYENVKGTLLGFWCPDYVGSVNVPGYHLHFISDDRTKGGHLLESVITAVTIKLDETPLFEMKLGENAAQGGLKDAEGEIKKVEK